MTVFPQKKWYESALSYWILRLNNPFLAIFQLVNEFVLLPAYLNLLEVNKGGFRPRGQCSWKCISVFRLNQLDNLVVCFTINTGTIAAKLNFECTGRIGNPFINNAITVGLGPLFCAFRVQQGLKQGLIVQWNFHTLNSIGCKYGNYPWYAKTSVVLWSFKSKHTSVLFSDFRFIPPCYCIINNYSGGSQLTF